MESFYFPHSAEVPSLYNILLLPYKGKLKSLIDRISESRHKSNKIRASVQENDSHARTFSILLQLVLEGSKGIAL